MILRPPSVPLITVDPYFSLWSPADRLTDIHTCHWTNRPMNLQGVATIDGVEYRFIGTKNADKLPAMRQVTLDVEAFTTTYVFEAAGVELTALFTTPILPFCTSMQGCSFKTLAPKAVTAEQRPPFFI